MPRVRRTSDEDGRLHCPGCDLWKDPSRFPSRKREKPNDVVWHFDRLCRDCQQTNRVDTKHEDPALALVERRAEGHGQRFGHPKSFMLHDMGYLRLVPIVRTLLGGSCITCGHDFVDEPDLNLDHIARPRHNQDFARLHVGNLRVVCHSCNGVKGGGTFEESLDRAESGRQTAIAREHERRQATEGNPHTTPNGQGALW